MSLPLPDRPSERRAHERLPRGELTVQLHRAGWAGLLRPSPLTRCIDYSRAGLQVECDQRLRVGDPVVVDLALHDIRAEELTGRVCSNCGEGQDGGRYGLCFVFEFRRHMRTPQTTHRLLQIEAYLRRQANG